MSYFNVNESAARCKQSARKPTENRDEVVARMQAGMHYEEAGAAAAAAYFSPIVFRSASPAVAAAAATAADIKMNDTINSLLSFSTKADNMDDSDDSDDESEAVKIALRETVGKLVLKDDDKKAKKQIFDDLLVQEDNNLGVLVSRRTMIKDRSQKGFMDHPIKELKQKIAEIKRKFLNMIMRLRSSIKPS